MKNYEYIIAGLPVLESDFRGELDVDGVISDIREQLDRRDAALLQTLLDGFEADNLCPDFYRKAAGSSNAFLREYFAFDLGLRNCKVAYLNRELGRPEGTDVMVLDPSLEEQPAFAWQEAAEAVFSCGDILSRERGLDDLTWRMIDEATVGCLFDMDTILSFVARMKIVDRWLKLDPETGRELFKRLVRDIRNNKKEIR